MTEAKKPQDELARVMREGYEKAQCIINVNTSVQRWAQQLTDLSNAGSEVIKYPSPDSVNWQGAIDTWKRANSQADIVLHGLSAMSISALNSTASGLNFTMIHFATSHGLYLSLTPQQQTAALSAQNSLNQVIDQSIRKDDIILLMRQFGLDARLAGKKTAIEQFEIAWAAYEAPVTQSSPVNTSLIPMREAIETTIQELMRRRPNQEAAKNQQSKILSIGNQLAQHGISRSDIQPWALQWDELANDLSGSKQANISRNEWRNLLRRGALFLQALLQGLDPAKLRGV